MSETQKETKTKKSLPLKIGIALIAVLATAAGALYYFHSKNQIYIEKAEISSPLISLSSKSGGKLEELMVAEGDTVKGSQVVARIGNELVKTEKAGLVLKVNDNIGRIFGPGEAVVTMIDPADLRVIGHIEEDKGLADIKVGQTAAFSVDAMGSKEFTGIVDEISDTARDSDIVFSISDKREKKSYDVKVRFNYSLYPELKNGMSAKVWIDK